MKKLFILLFLFCANQSLFAMEAVAGNFYYNKDNLAALDRLGMQKHAPLMILIDQSGTETPTSNPFNLLNTSFLAISLHKQSFPILVTSSVLENLVIRISTKAKKEEKDILLWGFLEDRLNSNNWFLFNVPNSQFILLVPKTLLSIYGNNLGFKKLPDLTYLLGFKKPNDYQLLIKELQKKRSIPFNVKQLEQIFINKNNQGSPIWDVFINGHGGYQCPWIAGLEPHSINALLSFFDTYVKTGIVYMISCFAGGENKLLLEKTNDIPINHSYIFILGSINNREIIVDAEQFGENLINFFNYAADLRDKGTSFNEFLHATFFFFIKHSEPHGASTIPQVWFPGGAGFKLPIIYKNGLTLNNILLQKYLDNQKPIIVQDKLALFLFPHFIEVPLVVYPIYLSIIIPKLAWKNVPLWFENIFFENLENTKKGEIIKSLINEKLLPDFGKHNPNWYEYPEFISMPLFDQVHIFSDIAVKSTMPIQGLLQFMRESFFDVRPQAYSQTFLIDKLQGINDLSLNMAAVRILNNASKSPLELALEDAVNQEITLEKVKLTYKHLLKEIEISFVYKGIPWGFNQSLEGNAPSTTWWNFKKLPDSYLQDYQRIKEDLRLSLDKRPSQKSLTDVLKQKQTDIAKKKTQEQERPRARL